FAVASFKDNGVSGVISQGLGTSMLQIPNVLKKPIVLLPAVIASAIVGPIATALNFYVDCTRFKTSRFVSDETWKVFCT
ncbi:PTS sugar transporter subunit IIC, partial [Paraburkholderia sp. SIMBA_049]